MDIDSDYILVKNREGGDLTEIDLDDNGNLAVESLQSQFGGSAIGLRFQNPATGNFRAVKVQCGVLFPHGVAGDRKHILSPQHPMLTSSQQPPHDNLRAATVPVVKLMKGRYVRLMFCL